ncbi:MAG TPA: VC0807 family protein [Marmoricola sp.]|jgi:hypothetical protein|nr:VC0807 family protein [Marmoricola sp.]
MNQHSLGQTLRVHPNVHASDVVSHVIELGHLKPAVAKGLRLLLETVVVPTMLLYVCMLTVGQMWGLVAVLSWCFFTVGVRMMTVRRIPGTLMLCIAMLVGRTSIALALSSVYVYLLQPVAGSVLMAVLFIGSALLGRPITMRLAQDFVHLPVRLAADRRCRRMFIQVSLLWGVSRLLDAGMSIGVLHWGLAAGIFSRGVFSGALTAISVLVCAYWGWSRLRRIPGVEFRLGGGQAAA